MSIHTQPRRSSLPNCCPLDPINPARCADFKHFWRCAVDLVGLPARTADLLGGADSYRITCLELSVLLKALNTLDVPRRALLLVMICLQVPSTATWLHREHGLHFGHLNAHDLGNEIFQIVVGLLANHCATPRT